MRTVPLSEADFMEFPRSLGALSDQLLVLEWLVTTSLVQAITVADHVSGFCQDALDQQCSVWELSCAFRGPRGQQVMVIAKRGSWLSSGRTPSVADLDVRIHRCLLFLLANADISALTFSTYLPKAERAMLLESSQCYGLRSRLEGETSAVTVFKLRRTVPASVVTDIHDTGATPTDWAALLAKRAEDTLDQAVSSAAAEALRAGEPVMLAPFEAVERYEHAREAWSPVVTDLRAMKCLLQTPPCLVLHNTEKVKRVYHCASLPLEVPATLGQKLPSAPGKVHAVHQQQRRAPHSWHHAGAMANAHYNVDHAIVAAIAPERARLPILGHRDAVLQSIRHHTVTILEGPTGSGKTTQVPQYVADCPGLLPPDRPVILVTQPRRIAAINAAIRVAYERGQEVGDEVGYLIRFEAAMGPATRIVYLTSGVLLRRLQDDPELRGVGCVMVDDVHERSLDVDFILLIMKELSLSSQLKCKLVVMSATLQANTFVEYFAAANAKSEGSTNPSISRAPSSRVHLEGRMYPVEPFFLEEALSWTAFRADARSGMAYPGGGIKVGCAALLKSCLEATPEALATRQTEMQHLQAVTSKAEKAADAKAVDPLCVQADLIASLVMVIHDTGLRGAILVFLPGLRDIDDVQRTLEAQSHGKELLILPIHSMLPAHFQQALFQPPPWGTRKVVLATNIAESSITVDDIVFVIDSGLMKGMQYDPNRNISSLNNMQVAQANALQRRGRAGRVQPGVCIHLLPRAMWDKLDQSPASELLQVPLEEVCLRIKALGKEDVHAFLGLAIDAPKRPHIDNAVQHLLKIGALNSEGKLNGLGRMLAAMPLAPKLGKLLLLGAMFGVLFPAAVIAAFMASRSPYIATLDPALTERLRQRRQRAFQDMKAPASDYVILLRIFKDWLATHDPRAFAKQYGLHENTMREVRSTVYQYLNCFQDEMKFEACPQYYRHASNEILTSAVVALCMYPNVVAIKSVWHTTHDPLPVGISRDSIVAREKGDAVPELLAFFEHIATESKARVGICGEVPTISVALMCQSLEVVRRWTPNQANHRPAPSTPAEGASRVLLLCDGWLFLELPDQAHFDTLLAARRALADQTYNFATSRQAAGLKLDFLDAVATAIGGGEDLGGPWDQGHKAAHAEA
eukprot:EG_transcript_1056